MGENMIVIVGNLKDKCNIPSSILIDDTLKEAKTVTDGRFNIF